jgi:O-antigen ligase
MNWEKVNSGIDSFILFCFCVFVFFLPIAHTESIRAFSFGIPLGIWLLRMIFQRRWLAVKTPLDLPILLFTIVSALSLITAVDFRYSVHEYFGEWLSGILLFYLVANNVREEQMKYVLGALLLGNVVMVNYGIYDFFHRGGVLFDYQVRAKSLHSGFYTFSVYLLTTIPYLLTAFFFVKRSASRRVLLLLLFLNVWALYLTLTRGAWVAMAIVLLGVGWKLFSKKWLLFSAGAAVLTIFLFAPQKILIHHTEITSPGVPHGSIETSQARWELTKFSLEKIWENPFQMIGYGRGSFVKKYRDFFLQYEGAQLWHAHNVFFDVALQTGVQGLVFFLFLLYKLLRFLYVSAAGENSPLRKYYLLSSFLMVISFFLVNLFDDSFVDDSALLFWFLVGAAVALTKGTPGRFASGK